MYFLDFADSVLYVRLIRWVKKYFVNFSLLLCFSPHLSCYFSLCSVCCVRHFTAHCTWQMEFLDLDTYLRAPPSQSWYWAWSECRLGLPPPLHQFSGRHKKVGNEWEGSKFPLLLPFLSLYFSNTRSWHERSATVWEKNKAPERCIVQGRSQLNFPWLCTWQLFVCSVAECQMTVRGFYLWQAGWQQWISQWRGCLTLLPPNTINGSDPEE